MTPKIWLTALLVCGCAHAPRPVSPAAHPSSAAVKPSAEQPSFELASLGLQVRMPGPVELFENDLPTADGPSSTRGALCNADSQLYFVARYFRAGRNRVKDDALLQNAKKTLKVVAREASIVHGEWAGIDLEGTDQSGASVWRRAFAIGDGFWMAQVQRVEGKLDRAAARAFLDSIVLSQPWSVHAFADGRFSVLMPDDGVIVNKEALHAQAYAVAELSWVGGTQERAFGVWAIPLEGDAVTPDERLDHASELLTSDGTRIIWQAPIVVDADRGRDFLTQKDATWTRIRLVVSGTDLYMLQATASTKEGLLEGSVPRFLASFRHY